MSESEDDRDVESWVIMVRWERVAGMVGGTLVRPGTTLQLTWPALLSVLSLRVSDTSRDTLPPLRPDQSNTDDTPGHTSDTTLANMIGDKLLSELHKIGKKLPKSNQRHKITKLATLIGDRLLGELKLFFFIFNDSMNKLSSLCSLKVLQFVCSIPFDHWCKVCKVHLS